jgi:hypothetical protein
VFDEATSALDNATEREVMAAIEALGGSLRVILIAHRLSTVERRDLAIEPGSRAGVVGQGRYEELLATSRSFSADVGGSHYPGRCALVWDEGQIEHQGSASGMEVGINLLGCSWGPMPGTVSSCSGLAARMQVD